MVKTVKVMMNLCQPGHSIFDDNTYSWIFINCTESLFIDKGYFMKKVGRGEWKNSQTPPPPRPSVSIQTPLLRYYFYLGGGGPPRCRSNQPPPHPTPPQKNFWPRFDQHGVFNFCPKVRKIALKFFDIALLGRGS